MMVWGIGTTSGQDIEIKGGALIQRKGTMNLINKVVIVKKNFTEVKILRERAQEMENDLQIMYEKETDENNRAIIDDMTSKLSEITGSRKKRSLLPFVGTALNRLFGVATEGDIKREKERLDRIEEWAQSLGNIIQGSVGILNEHAMIINNISNSLNVLSETLEDQINKLERKLIFQDIALKIDELVNNIKFKLDALLEAKLNRVSVNLLSFAELEEILSYSIVNFLVKPFDMDIISYYNILSVKVIHDQVFILLPFDDNIDMNVYKVTPFPMQINDKVMILDSQIEIVFERKRMDLVSLWSNVEFENSCVEIQNNDFVCNKDLFYTQNIKNTECLNYLLNNGDDNCKYVSYEKDFKVEMLDNKIYVFTKEKEQLVVSCNGKESRMFINNVHIFPRECHVKIINKFYYEPTIFREIQLNTSYTNFNFQLNVSKIQLPRVSSFASEVPNVLFLSLYKEKVMPVMTLVYYPLVVVVGVVSIVFIRRLVIKKINNINELLKVTRSTAT